VNIDQILRDPCYPDCDFEMETAVIRDEWLQPKACALSGSTVVRWCRWL